VSLPLAVVVPELGIPMLLLGLRLLARDFAWAARADAWTTVKWLRFQTWLRARPRIVQVLVLLASAVVAVLLLALLF
jgi:hypothetical protein